MPVSVGDEAITTSGSIVNSFKTGVLVYMWNGRRRMGGVLAAAGNKT